MNTGVLISWIGETDLRAYQRGAPPDPSDPGPLTRLLQDNRYKKRFSLILLLIDCKPGPKEQFDDRMNRVTPLKQHLERITGTEVQLQGVKLADPTNYSAIHKICVSTIENLQCKFGRQLHLAFFVSPGTG